MDALKGATRRRVCLWAAAPGLGAEYWHGWLHVLEGGLLGLVSFPLGLIAWPIFRSTQQGVRLPYYWGDPTFGGFSAALDVAFVAAGVLGYVQWFVLIPRVASSVAAWKARRPGRRQPNGEPPGRGTARPWTRMR